MNVYDEKQPNAVFFKSMEVAVIIGFLINSHFQLLPWLQNSDNLTEPTRTITFPSESDYLLPALWPCSDQQREREIFFSGKREKSVNENTVVPAVSPRDGHYLISAAGLYL